MTTKHATDDASSSELTVTIIKRVIRRMRREGRPITMEMVCQEIEDFEPMPNLADKVTTGMVKRALSTFQ
jgi:hypothetical protein